MQVTDEMIEAAYDAWDAYKPTQSDASGYGAMRAALTAALTKAWRPIESAPRDWSDVLLQVPDLASDWRSVCEGYFDADLTTWHSPAFGVVKPTHWMPLPAPPATKEPGER